LALPRLFGQLDDVGSSMMVYVNLNILLRKPPNRARIIALPGATTTTMMRIKESGDVGRPRIVIRDLSDSGFACGR
jgi:hypothetical protein